jgi:inner membrane protein
MKTPIVLRCLVVAFVACALLIPISLIQGKILERRSLAEGVERSFAAETSRQQLVVGPMLQLTCEETIVVERQVMRAGKAETLAEPKTIACPTSYFTPTKLRVTGAAPVETRHRGIYPIRLYHATLDISAEFEWPKPPEPNGANPRQWKQVHLVTLVSDPRGIKDSTLPLTQNLGLYGKSEPGSLFAFVSKLELAGTSSLGIAPVGDSTEISLKSNWPHPSFSGAWTPDQRDITSLGFNATWNTSYLATGGRAYWEEQARSGKILESRQGATVVFFDPVNIYALSYRATEYGFLFVLFTFAAIAMVEVIAGVRLHPIQYALVGLALAVFFLLLIALSEHLSFDRAYLAAASACLVLIVFYLRHPLGTRGRAATLGALSAGLYGALFVLLKSEDHALLMGSLMVFAALAAVMLATRKLDWTQVAARMATPPPDPEPSLE